MLRHLDGRIDDEVFMRFSVACCRRIWSLLSDARSRAVVESTEAYLAGALSREAAGAIAYEWDCAYEAGEVRDLTGGATHDAIASVCGLGFGHAAQVAIACAMSAGYAASIEFGVGGTLQSEVTEVWKAAETAERLWQCKLLQGMFRYRE